MKRFLIPFIVLILFALSSCVSTVEYKKLEDKVAKLEKDIKVRGLEGVGTSFRPYSGGLGTGANNLGKTTGTVDKDAAIVITNDEATFGNAAFFYSLDVDGGGTQSVPYIIDSGDGGNEDWEWCDVYGRNFYGYSPFLSKSASCTIGHSTGTECDGNIPRVAWGGIVLSTADAVAITLPEIVASAPTEAQVVPGASLCIVNADDSEHFHVVPYTDDTITDELGAANAAGHYIATGGGVGSSGDFICLLATSASNWNVMGFRNKAGALTKE